MTVATAAPPHAPEVGRARRLLGDYHVTGLFWYRLHRWAMASLPEWTVGPIIAVFTTFFFLTIINIRRAIASNLEPVLGPAGFLTRQRRIYATMWSFAWCLSERYQRLTTDRRFEVEVEGLDHWRAVTGSRSGFVMVTAHLGMYEVGSMLPASEEDRHVHLVREPEVDPRAQEFIRASVAAVESTRYTMHFQNADPLQGMVLLEALRRGEIVAMQADRPRAGAKVIAATLFGRAIDLPAGPAALARTARVPVLPVFAIREGWRRYRVILCPPIEVARSPDRARDLADAVGRIAREVEGAIRRAPHQWFCFRSIWEDLTPSYTPMVPRRTGSASHDTATR